ncbi:MAG: hypothetical protein KA712_16245 [Myxococcales bacterium]|nr:hypothetical protein [Myxococcales bacterium]
MTNSFVMKDESGKPVVLCVCAETRLLVQAAQQLRAATAVEVAATPDDGLARMARGGLAVCLAMGSVATPDFVAKLHGAAAAVPILLLGVSDASLETASGVFACLDASTSASDLVTTVLVAAESGPPTLPAKAPPKVARTQTTAAVEDIPPPPPPPRDSRMVPLPEAAFGAAWALVRLMLHMDPIMARRCMKQARHVQEILKAVQSFPTWPGEVAALSRELGRASLGPGVREKLDRNQVLGPHEKLAVEAAPATTHEIVKRLPGGEEVMAILEQFPLRFDGRGAPGAKHTAERIAAGARALKLAVDYEALQGRGMTHAEIMEDLRKDEGRYDPRMLGAVDEIETPPPPEGVGDAAVNCGQLKVGMVLEEPLLGTDGATIMAEGTRLSESDVSRIGELAKSRRIREKVLVRLSA